MQKPDFLKGRKGITFVDLFAGAGGFSEGFMQAYTDKNYYDFILASDINENCELTHRVRYNKMLGLDTEFICQDIMEESFLPNLLKKLKNKTIDVVTGGPSWHMDNVVFLSRSVCRGNACGRQSIEMQC